MFKKLFFLKDRDYWLYLIGYFGILAGSLAIISPIDVFRVPGIVVFSVVAIISFFKLKKDYTLKKAKYWVVGLLAKAIVVGLGFYLITN